jgi:23S rRNA (cytosine1962-C5)-methyltransferase
MKEINIKLKKETIKKYKSGYSLIEKEAILNLDNLTKEGLVVNLVDSSGNFVAKGYYGRQNKGYGWVLSLKQSVKFDKEFFKSKIENAKAFREDFFKSKDTNAFRLFNGEGDGVGGLSIDYYNGYLVVTWYSIGIYSFKEAILEAIKESIDFKGIYQKRRFESKGQYIEGESDYLLGKKAPEPLIVKENGVNFAVYLDDGAMVGVFLDQKDVRKTIKDKYAKGKTVLNTFSYTGAFSVYAALGGAKSTTSVDLAKRSLPKTAEQFEVNGIDSNSQNIVVQDVFDYFKYAIRKELKFDIVIADPPSFARSKKHTFSVAKDYKKLLKDLIKLTNKSGIIIASTNHAGLSVDKFKAQIDKAFSESGLKYKIVEEFRLPKDFKYHKKLPLSNYLKVFFIKLL